LTGVYYDIECWHICALNVAKVFVVVGSAAASLRAAIAAYRPAR